MCDTAITVVRGRRETGVCRLAVRKASVLARQTVKGIEEHLSSYRREKPADRQLIKHQPSGWRLYA